MRDLFSKIQFWVDSHAIALATGACAVLVVAGILLIIAVARLNNVPSWWQQVDAVELKDVATIQQAERLENAITTQLTMIRDTDNPQWSVAINPDQANAWLAVRLKETIITHQGEGAWPSEIDQVRIGIKNSQLTIGARTASATGSVIVWAMLALELDEQGNLWARVYSAHAGTARIPVRTMGLIGRAETSASRFKVGSGQLKLGDGRVAQLIALRVNNGRLEMVMETRVQD